MTVCDRCGQLDMMTIANLCLECRQADADLDEWIGDDELEDCPDCGGSGELPHDCGEDTCCCLDPESEICDRCDGDGRI